MLIVGDEIFNRNLLQDADKKHVSNATYYLTIEKIIRGGQDKESDSVEIAPNGIAWIVSKERFNIASNDIIALVSLKSSLTKQGLLALDTGFVDPRFKGPIGTIVVNFSKNTVTLTKGDEFFRVLFFSHNELTGDYVSRSMTNYASVEAYANERKKEISRDYYSTFLNLEQIKKQIQDDVLDSATNTLRDELIFYAIKKYWWVILLTAVLLIGVVSFGASKVGDMFTKAEIKQMIQSAMLDEKKEAKDKAAPDGQ
jgi:deoxycytidine triphosphate deaminase